MSDHVIDKKLLIKILDKKGVYASERTLNTYLKDAIKVCEALSEYMKQNNLNPSGLQTDLDKASFSIKRFC